MNITPALLSTIALAAALPAAQAQEFGQVVSRTPVYQQVAVTRQVCSTTPTPAQPKSSSGSVVGAIAGGLIGSALGGRDNRTFSAGLGAIGGAMLGDHVDTQAAKPGASTVCQNQTSYENRLQGWSVVYDFNGKRYTTQLAVDPGPTVPLQITPMVPPMPPTAPMISPAPTPLPVPAPVQLAPAATAG